MNPYLKFKNEYKAALKKVAEYKIPSTTKFESLIDGVDVDAIKRSALISMYKKTSEFASLFIENLTFDEIEERIWATETKIIREIDEAILKIKRLMPMVHDVFIPLRNVVNLIFQHGGIEECCGTDIKFHLTAHEVFESLSDLDDSISKLLIRRIDVKSPSTTERLLASYAVKDMETFCSVLNGDECDISEIERFFSLEMIQHASVFNESTIPEILEHFDERINDAFTGEQTNQIAIESPRLILDILPDYLEIYNLLPDYLDFVIVLLSECSLTEEERSAIESILYRPEVVDLYNERKEAYDKNKSEAQIDEQPSQSKVQYVKELKESNKIPHSRRGAPRQFWMKSPVFSEEEASDIIRSYVWPDLQKALRTFEYPKSLSVGENKETAVKALGAAIILYSAQNVGLADPEKKYSSSLERTLRFLPAPASTVKYYCQMMSKYEKASELYQNGDAREASFVCTDYKDNDPLRGQLLLNNFLKIEVVLKRTNENLRKAFNL